MAKHQKVVYLPNGWVVKYGDDEHTSITLVTAEYKHFTLPISEAQAIAEAITALGKDAIRSEVLKSMHEFNKNP